MTRSANPEEGPTLLEISEALVENQSQIDELRSLVEKLEGQLVTMRELLAPSEAALRARNEYLGRQVDKSLSQAERRISDSAQALNEQRNRLLALAEQIPARMNEIERQVLRRLGLWSTVSLLMIGAAAGLCVIAVNRASAPPPFSVVPLPQPAAQSQSQSFDELFDQAVRPKSAPPGTQRAPGKTTSRVRPGAAASPSPASAVRW